MLCTWPGRGNSPSFHFLLRDCGERGCGVLKMRIHIFSNIVSFQGPNMRPIILWLIFPKYPQLFFLFFFRLWDLFQFTFSRVFLTFSTWAFHLLWVFKILGNISDIPWQVINFRTVGINASNITASKISSASLWLGQEWSQDHETT